MVPIRGNLNIARISCKEYIPNQSQTHKHGETADYRPVQCSNRRNNYRASYWVGYLARHRCRYLSHASNPDLMRIRDNPDPVLVPAARYTSPARRIKIHTLYPVSFYYKSGSGLQCMGVWRYRSPPHGSTGDEGLANDPAEAVTLCKIAWRFPEDLLLPETCEIPAPVLYDRGGQFDMELQPKRRLVCKCLVPDRITRAEEAPFIRDFKRLPVELEDGEPIREL